MIRKLVIDIMCYCKNQHPFDYSDEEWFNFTIDTLEDIQENRLDTHIKYFEDELNRLDELEEYEVEEARDILNRLITYKLNYWNMIMDNVRESFLKKD